VTTYAGRPVFPASFVDPTGNPQEAVTVTVYLRGTTTPATLYTSRTKATTVANPTVTDSLGNFFPFLDPGDYDALCNGVTLPFTVLPESGDVVSSTGGGKEPVRTIANAGSAATLDLALANVFDVLNPAAASTCTLTLTGATAGVNCSALVRFHQRASGDSLVAFSNTYRPMNEGTLPGPAQVANAVSTYVVSTIDGGATWDISKAGDSGVSSPPAVPSAPTAVVGTRGNTQVSVAFSPGASNPATTGYSVTASPGGITATGASSPIVVTGLTNGTAYTFTVHATNSVGNSAESSASAAVTPATVPGAPTAVSGTPGNTTASIAFTAPASNGGSAITGYTATLTPGGATFSGASSPIVVTGLTNGTAYTATVHATNAIGNSAESTASGAFTPAVGPSVPGAPNIGTATGGNASATVTWTAPGSNGGSAITGYRVTPYIGATAQTPTTVGVVLTANITGLTNGTAYTFKVAAINAVGTGADSAASNSVTPAGAFGGPGDIAGLLADYDPDTITGVDLDPVPSWSDSSTNAFTATQATGTVQPLLRVNAFGTHKGVQFDGSNDFMDSLLPADTKPFTIVTAVKMTDLAAYGAIIGSATSGAMELRAAATTGLLNLMKQGTSQIGASTTGLAAGTAAIVVIRYSSTGVWTFHINGGANVGTGTNDQTFTASTSRIAQGGAAAGENLKGLLGRLIKYDSDLSLANLNNLVAWLGTRLGITTSTLT